LWDDLLPVYLLYPDLFDKEIIMRDDRLKQFSIRNVDEIKIKFLEILKSRNDVKSLVFKGFPDMPELYADDVRPFMKRIIQKYGKEEWRIGVLTNELHGHLGIYSIIGAKMGMRARQYFNIGVDDISIVSYAGSTPPLSCMNDGLQVSTGGTVGHGLFSVSSEPPYRPEAAITFKGRTIHIRLKDQYWDSVKADIQKGVELHGSGTENNWKYVRRLAIKYWLEWDRREIFILKKVEKEISPVPTFSLKNSEESLVSLR
jgi:pyrimidine-specific ribonucleoside hydrolase